MVRVPLLSARPDIDEVNFWQPGGEREFKILRPGPAGPVPSEESPQPTLETRRLRLRVWREHDLAPFATLNADPRVMEFLPKPLGRADSDALVSRIRDHFARHGFGLWAVEAPGVANFIGFVGLRRDRLATGA